ncbi:CS1 type fimbrial major subunit [Pantoea dispersa]|uniref:CS1 type fimbrial major subunit n=1 Tax=Pantoea dispersa TaxID=59814 RepID=UPI0039B66CA2
MNKLLIMAGLIVTTSVSAVPEELTFELNAKIPASRFYVVFQDPSFGSTVQEMKFEQASERLESLSTNIRARNTSGKVVAYLKEAPELTHQVDDTKKIPLNISIDNKTLSNVSSSAVEIIGASESDEKVLPLVIQQGSTATFTDSGDYSAQVTLMFESVI